MATQRPRTSGRRARRQTPARERRAGAVFTRLVRVMDILRSPGGCPWDRRQSHETLRAYLLEETYEALDAIDRRDRAALCGELGDVLLQCVFHARIAAETNAFDVVDLVESVTEKLVRRHPHVFTPAGRRLTKTEARRHAHVRTPADVKTQWAAIKAKEQGPATTPRRVLAGVPKALPALLGAHKIGGRVAEVGFDWPNTSDVVDKIDEEVHELRHALARKSRDEAVEEMGDLLFSIANLSRKLGIDPESALRQANAKFVDRFNAVEAALERRGESVHAATLESLESEWQRVKTAARQRRRRSPTGR